MATWGFESDNFIGEENNHRLTVTNAVGSGTGVGGFIYRAGAMLFAYTYPTIREAMDDLAVRARNNDFSIQMDQPDMGNPFSPDVQAFIEQSVERVDVGYRLDESDVDSIHALVATAQQYEDLHNKLSEEN